MRILIVEDDDMNLEIISTILEINNYEVLQAIDAAEGYKKALDHKPDLIITDYHLIGANGAEMVQKIRATNGIKHIPIIALTADIYSQQELLKAGCDAYLTKPARRRSLLHKVSELLSIKTA